MFAFVCLIEMGIGGVGKMTIDSCFTCQTFFFIIIFIAGIVDIFCLGGTIFIFKVGCHSIIVIKVEGGDGRGRCGYGEMLVGAGVAVGDGLVGVHWC